MTDKMRWRYGDTNPVVAAVQASTVIEIGDLLYQEKNPEPENHDHAIPRGEHQTLMEFTQKFLGVAMKQSRRGETDPIRVATTGVFEFDCPRDTGAYELGEFMGANKKQEVERVKMKEQAIGRIAKTETIYKTSVLVDIVSTVMRGGVLSN